MRLITPSFHSNPFFATDLNAISPRTSPGDLFGLEHLSGEQYAAYLSAVVEHYELSVQENCAVNSLRAEKDEFLLETDRERIRARFVIWATGEFSFPDTQSFPGAKLCQVASEVGSWKQLPGSNFVVIGGYESGMDAAYHLAIRGCRVDVLSRGEPWKIDDPDPSVALSPYTKERLARVARALPESVELHGEKEVIEVVRDESGYRVLTLDGDSYATLEAPILATGFDSGIKRQVASFFDWEGKKPVFSAVDSSTLHPNLFYSGPSLVHRESKFCFIYKFRSRFGVIAQEIGIRLGLDTSELSDWEKLDSSLKTSIAVSIASAMSEQPLSRRRLPDVAQASLLARKGSAAREGDGSRLLAAGSKFSAGVSRAPFRSLSGCSHSSECIGKHAI